MATILSSYAALLVTFAGVYYFMADVGDNADAVVKWRYYRLAGRAASLDAPPFPVGDGRAFRGIEARLWYGVDWPRVPHADSGDRVAAPRSVAEMVQVAKKPPEETIAMDDSSRLPVLFDCLYLSVVTATTVGYGDITPAAWYAKLACMVQSLSAAALLVVALGLLLGNWWDEPGAAPRPVPAARLWPRPHGTKHPFRAGRRTRGERTAGS